MSVFQPNTSPLPPVSAPNDKYQYNSRQQMWIVDTVNLEKLQIQTVPPTLDYTPESTIIAVASMSQNNPIYFFTGSEDTLEFDLDWYSIQENRQDVIAKCKWIEALSKDNGYLEPQHPVKLLYGVMFTESKWIVSSAKYTMKLPHPKFGMLPTLALQHLILKRIVDTNRTTKDIRNIYT